MKAKLIDNISKILNDTFRGISGFLKGQLILMGITFVIISTGLLFMDMPLPFLIALGIAISDIIPIIGSGIVMIPWIVISFITGNTYNGAGLAIIYLVFIIARQILEPVIIGGKIGIRPLYTFFSSIIGSLIFGPLGFIIGPVIAIIINSIYKLKKFY
jgi:predicted PurR-regulated permease PerM